MLFTKKTASLLMLVAGLAACDQTDEPMMSAVPTPQFIVNGEPTGNRLYGNVGALYYDFNENGRVDGDDLVCTGSLISETVFLTAAHCVEFLPAGSQLYV